MRAHAEVAQVWTRDGRIRVVGRVHDRSATYEGPWRLLLALRGETRRHHYVDANIEGAVFDATVPVDALVPGSLSEPVKWDLHLVADTGPKGTRLRVGKHLDDIRGKKKIMVFPAQQVALGNDAVEVRPLYTVKDNLSIECRPIRSGQQEPVRR